MIPKLTDFSKEELNYAVSIFEIRLHKYNYHIYQYESYGGTIGTSLDQYIIAKNSLAHASQWLTKLAEALQEVERNERIQSN